MTEYLYDTEIHRKPFYIALFCSICYGIAYLLTTYAASFDSELHFRDAKNTNWATEDELSSVSGFSSNLQLWSVLCIARNILVIIAWIVFCTQSNWNIGSNYIVKIEMMESTKKLFTKFEQIYQHLFYGNPYLPYGVFEVLGVKDKEKNKEKKKEQN